MDTTELAALAERFPNMRVNEKSIQLADKTGYADGYKNGYEWLTRGSNFKHPSARNGYIPGGPYVFTARVDDKFDVRVYAELSRKYHNDWIDGWVDGINAYVRDNDLDYPQITK